MPDTPPRVHHTVSPAKPAQALQLLQGGYYVLAGLLTAFAVNLWTPVVGPAGEADLSRMWVVRAAAVVYASFGAALIYSGRRHGRAVPAGAGMWAALAAVVIETGAIALGALPTTFLIDVTVQAVFLVSWVAIMFRRIGRQASETGAAPAAG